MGISASETSHITCLILHCNGTFFLPNQARRAKVFSRVIETQPTSETRKEPNYDGTL